HGIYALENPVQNLLKSGAGPLLLRGLEETFAEFLQLFVGHFTSTNWNKDNAARCFLSLTLAKTFFGFPAIALTDDAIAGSHAHVSQPSARRGHPAHRLRDFTHSHR
ncbi:MAG: hypothetical protein ACM3ND_08765, partial [Acidobacteriota bacterium]